MPRYPFMERGRSEPVHPRSIDREFDQILDEAVAHFQRPPSRYATRPGEPPKLYPLDTPDYYDMDDPYVPVWRFFFTGLVMLGLAALLVYCAVQWVVAP